MESLNFQAWQAATRRYPAPSQAVSEKAQGETGRSVPARWKQVTPSPMATVSVETMQGARTTTSAQQKQVSSCPAGAGSAETQSSALGSSREGTPAPRQAAVSRPLDRGLNSQLSQEGRGAHAPGSDVTQWTTRTSTSTWKQRSRPRLHPPEQH